MAEFSTCFIHVLRHEGGYKLTETPGDVGGMTFAGISRRYNPDWRGWELIDAGGVTDETNTDLVRLVENRYRDSYWQPLCGTELTDDSLARSMFSTAVLFGVRRTIRMVQELIGMDRSQCDGYMGPVTMKQIELNQKEQKGYLLAALTVARINHHLNKVRDDVTQEGFFHGWVRRALVDCGYRAWDE